MALKNPNQDPQEGLELKNEDLGVQVQPQILKILKKGNHEKCTKFQSAVLDLESQN
jgi:hypothetical protein